MTPDTFAGAKLALFLEDEILVILRDDVPDIPFPGHWDFPGGGREGTESPESCILRETEEETGLILPPSDLIRVAAYARPSGLCWFFAAHISAARSGQVHLGDEGQDLQLMRTTDYIAHNRRIPHFAEWLSGYVSLKR